jgi:hypothetical protein
MIKDLNPAVISVVRKDLLKQQVSKERKLLIDAQKLQEKEQSKQVSELVSNYFTEESPDAKVFVSKIEIANGNPKVSKKK